MSKIILIGLSFAVLTLGLGNAYGQQTANPLSKPAHYDPRNFDGVWHLSEGGKFGPFAEKNGVKYDPKYLL